MLSRDRLEAYRADVDALGDSAVDYCAELLRAMRDGNPGATVAELRDAAIFAIEDTLSIFGDQAALLACDLFDELAAESGESARSGVHDAIDANLVESRVRYLARKLVTGDADGFDMDVRDLTRYLIKRDAFENMLRNCERNDLRYARVPSGRETCGFCLMLASRGFVYRSEKTAQGSHGFHNHCDCVIVPGFKGLDQAAQIEGYDPDGMAGRVNDCMDTIGGADGLRSLWSSMSKAERARYKGKSDSERFERFKTAQLAREIETRDWRWLHSGGIPSPTYQSGRARNEMNSTERKTRDVLALNGFVQHVLERSNVQNEKTADILLGNSGIRADYKTPRGSRFNSIDQLMRDAGKKAEVAVVHLVEGESVMSLEDAVSHFMRCGRRRGITEALFIDYDGSIVRVKI